MSLMAIAVLVVLVVVPAMILPLALIAGWRMQREHDRWMEHVNELERRNYYGTRTKR